MSIQAEPSSHSCEGLLPGARSRNRSRTSWRFLAVGTVLGFAVPVVAYFWLIQHDGVNAIWYDQWADINVIAHPTLSTLWMQHNEDRILFPNLIVLALAHTNHFNIHSEDFLSGIMLVGSAGLFIMAHKRRSPSTLWLFYCPVVIVMLSFVQFGNALWGFQIAWYLVLLSLACALFVLDRPMLTWWGLLAAMAVAIVGSFSSLQGLLIWPAGLVLLYSRSRPKNVIAVWVLAGIVTGSLYFYHYSSATADAGSTSSYMFSHPLAAAEFYLSAIGDIVGEQLSPVGHNYVIIGLGTIIFAVAIWVLITYGLRRDESGRAIGVALICVGLLFDVTITAGRAAYGTYYSDASRYTTFDLLVLVGIYLAILESPPKQSWKWHSIRIEPKYELANDCASVDLRPRESTNPRSGLDKPLFVVRSIVTAAIVILVVLGTANGLTQSTVWRQKLATAAAVEVNIDKASDNIVAGTLYPNPAPKTALVRELAQIARSRDLSVFATGAFDHYSKTGLPVASSLTSRVIAPTDRATLKGDSWLVASASVIIGSVKVNVDKVEFEVTGGNLKRAVIGAAGYTYFGWLDLWNSATVASGGYTIQSVAFSGGDVSVSPAVTITVDNP